MPSWKKVLISGSDAALNSLIVTNGITGSLFGTASWAISASRATTASYALTASYSQNLQISGSINNVDYIDFNTGSVTPAYKSGRVFFDNVDGALTVYNAEADIALQVGQENWVRVFNEGGLITNGTAVRIVGSHGDVPLIIKAQSVQVSGSALGDNQIIGIATHDIETNSIGYVTTQGLARGLATSTFTDGDLLFVSSSAGLLTNVIPQAPYEVIQVGICVKAGPGGSGIVFVFPTQPIDFGDLASAERGVYQYGDLWSYQQTGSVGVWKHGRSLSGSYSITGSLNVTQGITGSLLGTSSLATNVVGTANRILFNNATNTTTTSNNLTWTDSTNLLTLGDATGTAGTISKLALYTSSFGGYGLGVSPAQLDYVSDGSHVFYKNGSTPTELVRITNAGDVGIGTTNPTTKLDVAGVFRSVNQDPTGVGGITAKLLSYSINPYGLIFRAYATGQHSIQNQRESDDATVFPLLLQPNGGNVAIGKLTSNARLDISGSAIITGSLTVTQGITGSLFGTSSWASNATTAANYLPLTGGTLTGDLTFSKSTPTLNLTAVTAGSATINLTSNPTGGGDAIIATSTSGGASGDLVLRTAGTERIRIKGGTASVLITGSLAVSQSLLQYSNVAAVTSGSTANVASFATGSFTSAFFDYVTTSGTNARAGTVFTVWNGASVQYTETSTNDIGSTTNLILSASLSAGSIRLQARSLSGTWSVKTLARMI